MPISHSFIDDDLEVLEPRSPTSSISPPAMPHAMSSVPASTRSAMISLSAGAQLLDAFDLDRRRARADDLRAHAVEERGEVGDLRLARRVLDDGRALGEHRRGHQVLGRADARELEHDARAVQQRRRARATKPCATSTSAPIASSPRRCMSTLRLPMLSPPGSATRASPQRASSGPSTLNDARMRVTSSYGASGVSVADRVDAHDVGLGPVDARADRAQQVDHHVEVAHRRHVAQRRDAGREQRRGHLLQARVLRRARRLHAAGERSARADAEASHGERGYLPE